MNPYVIIINADALVIKTEQKCISNYLHLLPFVINLFASSLVFYNKIVTLHILLIVNVT